MLTLAIETSGPVGSVALFESGRVLQEQTLELGRQHGQSLIPAIGRLLDCCGKTPRDCGLVAVSVGPGSFTGLRVGVTCAKTLAYAAGCRLAAVDTLEAIACNAPPDVTTIEVISNANRGDVFAGRYVRTGSGSWARQGEIRMLGAPVWAAALTPDDTVTGPGLDQFAALVEGRSKILAPRFRVPQAAWIARLGIQANESGRLADLWSVEPLYFGPSSAEVQWEKLHPSGFPFPFE